LKISNPSVFLTHTWVKDELNRDNHARVGTVNKILKAQGFKTWFDEDKMVGHIDNMMAKGIDDSDIILVFISKVYMEKVASEDCQDYFCEICTRSHKTVKVTKNHKLIAINEMEDEYHQMNSITNSNSNSNNQLYCQIHQNEEMKLFCDDCKLPICPMCVEDHPSHKILILSNVIEIEKQSLLDLMDQVCFLSFLFFSFSKIIFLSFHK